MDVLQQIVSVDTDLMLSINSWHSVFFDGFMWGYTQLEVWIPFYIALAIFFAKNMKVRTFLIAFACVFLTILLCDQLCSHLIRPIVQRLRPANLDNPVSPWVHVVNDYRGGRFSFPSAHASNTFGLAFFLMYLFRNKWLTIVMMIWAFLNCYSRIYLGVHYPGDILAGFLIGFLVASFTYWIFKRWSHERPDYYPLYSVKLPITIWFLSLACFCIYAVSLMM